MKINFKKLLKFRNILWVLLILLIVIIGYIIFVYLKVFEGVVDLNTNVIKINNVRKIIIQPYGSNYEWLNIGAIILYDINNNVIPYTASATKFPLMRYWWRWEFFENYNYDDVNYNIAKLYDGNNNTMFHSAGVGCTLVITPTDDTKVVAKITIRNRQDCCQFRLDRYQLVLKNMNDDNIIKPILLKDVPNLFNASSPNTPYTEDIILPKDPKDGKDGVNGVNGAPGAPGVPGTNGFNGVPGVNGRDGQTTFIDSVSDGSIQKS